MSRRRGENPSVNGSHRSETTGLVRRSVCDWIESVWETSAIATASEAVCRNFESIMDQGIACTSDKKEQQSWCSSAEGIRAHRRMILKQPNGIGANTGGGHEKE
jgi:hypothetical protein